MLSVTCFYMVECASCTNVINEFIKYFCMHTTYIALIIPD